MSGLETRLLEQIRSKHEEIERLEQLVMNELTREELSPMEQLWQGYRLRSMTKAIILKTEKLVKTYEEKKDEIAELLGGETGAWDAFSNRLKEIHEYHEKHPCGPLLVHDDEELLVHDDDYGAQIDAKVEKLCNLLDEAISRTKGKGEKQEKPMEQAMGWDGKPIPYWLNQLGLGQEYKCEICRNHSYWGKKAFERHFQEPRHQWALFSYGILGREKKFNGITSIEEAKQVWKSLGGQCKDESQGGQCKDEEEEIFKDEEAVGSPPPCIRRKLEGVALVLCKKGLEHESLIRAKHGEKDVKLMFMKSSDPYHANPFLTEYQVSAYSDCYGDDEIETKDEEYTNPPQSLEMHKFTYRLAEGITAKELDLIKLAAEFWARYERCFYMGFKERMGNDPYFEFMMKRSTGARSTLFAILLSSYKEVLTPPPLQVWKEEKLRSNAADIETVLENCYHRLQCERFHRERFVKRAREKTERAKLPRRLLRSKLREPSPPPLF